MIRMPLCLALLGGGAGLESGEWRFGARKEPQYHENALCQSHVVSSVTEDIKTRPKETHRRSVE